jgi:hypothetical protein
MKFLLVLPRRQKRNCIENGCQGDYGDVDVMSATT